MSDELKEARRLLRKAEKAKDLDRMLRLGQLADSWIAAGRLRKDFDDVPRKPMGF